MDNKLTKIDLLETKEVFDSFGLDFFLIYGTALGAYRDGDFLPNDGDVDLGTFDNSRFPEIKSELERRGFNIAAIHDVANHQVIPSDMILSERNTRIDTYFFTRWPNEWVAWKHQYSYHPLLSMPLKFTKTAPIKFLGTTFKILVPTEEYLTYLYGDWYNKENKRQGKLYAEVHGIKEDKYI